MCFRQLDVLECACRRIARIETTRKSSLFFWQLPNKDSGFCLRADRFKQSARDSHYDDNLSCPNIEHKVR